MDKDIINLLSNGKKVETKEIIINKNIMRFNKETIQLSNISQFSIGKPALKIPFLAIFLFFFSFFLFQLVNEFAWFLFLTSGAYIGWTFYQYINSGYFFTLYLNSSKIYQIYVKEESFLQEIRDAVEDCFNHTIKSVAINIETQQINGSVAIGDHNNMNHGGEQTVTHVNSHNNDSFNRVDDHSTFSMGDIRDSQLEGNSFGNKGTIQENKNINYDWEMIESELWKVIQKLPQNENEVTEASQEAVIISREKNQASFKKVIEKYRNAFTSDLFVATASSALVQVIMNILG